MQTLDFFVNATLKNGREGFIQAYSHDFLLFKTETSKNMEAEEWSFQTRILAAPMPVQSTVRLRQESDQYRVYSLVKNAQNPWPDRISIGRARNNDVVIAEASVSKLHCHYMPTEAARIIVDINSKNGTYVNDIRIPPGEKATIALGDNVRLGSVQTKLINASGLYDVINEHLQK